MPNTFIAQKTLSSYLYVYLFISFQAIHPCSMDDPYSFMTIHNIPFLGLLDPSRVFFDSYHWHQWQLQFLPTIYPFVIDGNTHTLFLSPPIIMLLPLSLCSYLPLWHRWQKKCLLMFSCLVLWEGNHSQFLSDIFKGLSWKRFSEDVCNLLLCFNIFQYDILFCDMFS